LHPVNDQENYLICDNCWVTRYSGASAASEAIKICKVVNEQIKVIFFVFFVIVQKNKQLERACDGYEFVKFVLQLQNIEGELTAAAWRDTFHWTLKLHFALNNPLQSIDSM
jgi:hypothetical protein